jgi:2-oxoglutarate ferredoxin oxidoreductase subunit beta
VRDDKTIDLRPGQPMVFGKGRDKGLKIEGFDVRMVPAESADVWRADTRSAGPAFVMSQLDSDPTMPRPIGVFRSVAAPIFNEGVQAQVRDAVAKKGAGKLRDLFYTGDMWDVR